MKKTSWWGGHQLSHGGGKNFISIILQEAKSGTIGFKLMRIEVEDQTLYMSKLTWKG